MGRVKRGGYVFEFCVGDHSPRHVHIYKDHRMTAKVELDEELTVMKGRISRRLRKILRSLIKEGTII